MPLGEPRDDEPRLVAARGFPREPEGDEIHAYAAAPRPETAEHDALFETGEQLAPEEPRRARPCRCARPRTARRTPPRARRRPAPDQPRRRPPKAKTPKGPRAQRRRALGPPDLHADRRPALRGRPVRVQQDLPAVPRRRQRLGRGRRSRENSDAADVAKLLADKGVVDSARFFELKATISGDRGNFRPGRYTLKKGMTNGAAIDALTKVPESPKAAPDGRRDARRGPVDQGELAGRGGVQEGRRQLRQGRGLRGRPQAHPRARRAQGHQDRRGLPVPGHVQAPVGSPASDLVNQQLDAFEENFDRRRHEVRQVARSSRATTC